MARIIIILCISLFPASLIADYAPVIRVVRMQALLENSIAGKAARADLERDLNKSKAELERERIRLKKMTEDLQSQGMLLSNDAIEKKQEKIVEAERSLQRKAKDLHEDMQRKTARSIETIVAEVRTILDSLATEENFDFILQDDNRFVLYADSEIDITSRVIKILDEKKLDL